MARFRRRERKKFRGGGNVNVASHDDGQTSEEDDGVTLNNAVFKTAEVVQLEADSSYQEMLKQEAPHYA